jgi:hypothetical protein
MNQAAAPRWFRTHRTVRYASLFAYSVAVLALVVASVAGSPVVAIALFASLLVVGVSTSWWLLNARCPICAKAFTNPPAFGFWPPPSSFRSSCASCGASSKVARRVA